MVKVDRAQVPLALRPAPRSSSPSRASAAARWKCASGIISVGLEAPTQPDDRFGIGTELRLGEATHTIHRVSKDVARRKAECLVDVSFGFCASTEKILGVSR